MFQIRADLREYGHPDVIIQVDPQWSRLADWLPNYFADEVRRGVRFEAEQTIQLGWSLLKLEQTDDGDLLALEPDFETMPVRWVCGVSRAVRLLALQRAVCEECQVEPDFPSMRQATSLPEEVPLAEQFTMARLESQGNISGWIIHEGRDAAMRLVSLYEVALTNKAIVPFLALPAGAVVERDRKVLSVAVSGRHYSTSSSELLARIAAGEPFEVVLPI